MWPPPTALGPAGVGGGTYQSRTNAAVLPAAPPLPPPPPIPQQAPPPAEPPRAGDPMWPEPNAAPSTSSQYGDWARRQRPQGTVYGGAPPAHDPARNAPGPTGYETSGSLTGHILAQGHPDTGGRSSGGSKAVIIIMIIMGVLVVGGLAAAIAWLSGVFG
jgi:hypothetical protein